MRNKLDLLSKVSIFTSSVGFEIKNKSALIWDPPLVSHPTKNSKESGKSAYERKNVHICAFLVETNVPDSSYVKRCAAIPQLRYQFGRTILPIQRPTSNTIPPVPTLPLTTTDCTNPCVASRCFPQRN